ncbi:M23 family metallopeptidase [Streptomyces spinosirectus]|uniref:M23 family metallopeptidase n=1 Tax=Streptomyces TaxID=1883 RepID=UPI001C9D8635|nr:MULTISPECIES: M23 family metallopeptidase [Streptomyces]MBY8344333.1 M23 family metallopeptidase [Streptomyces plumbidurans]UIR18622.1 M23 family metallopeptidase [Streptomyces spinosirectus]
MNDRHPSGTMTTPAPASHDASAPFAPYGTQEAQYGDFTTYGSYDANGFATGAHPTATFDADPLFGSLPGEGTASYDASQWDTGQHRTAGYDAYATPHHPGYGTGVYDNGAYGTGAYDTTAWSGQQPLPLIPHQATGPDHSGQWDASAWLQPDQAGAPADPTQQWEWGTQTFDTGAYDATQWNSDGGQHSGQFENGEFQGAEFQGAELQGGEPFDQHGTAVFEQIEPEPYAEHGDDAYAERSEDPYEQHAPGEGELASTGELPSVAPLLEDQEEVVPSASRTAARAASRSRRRAPARRSALLTIAVPSACVMGVAGIAAASVGTFSDDKDSSTTASDAHAVKPSAANNKLDSQLQSLSAGADDFADRASRTQERIDLKAQQAAEKKKAAEEAARKERLRPKFVLPVTQKGLSAYFGQAGVNWMSVHTGIDFPVSYGTTVMAATDGVARTQWNSAYGNMMIVTAKDGTETWYCHLSRYQVASGTAVKAGTPIAFSGNSGNSTGPHLHFEVRPGGGSAIDPLPWLRSHGLDPT